MSRYDGLIIPRSYSEYINKTDAATLSQALALPGVMDAAPTESSNKAARSGGIYNAIDAVKPVDTVALNNMHSVTSNAVFFASSPNYANKQLIFDGLTHYQNNDYVVPDNGFIIASGWGTGQSNNYIGFTINGVTVQNQGNADESISVVIPVRKDDIVGINIYLASHNSGCYFVPCN